MIVQKSVTKNPFKDYRSSAEEKYKTGIEAYTEGALHASRLTFEIEGQSRSHGSEKESDAPIANYPSGTTKKGFVAESRVRSRVKGLRRSELKAKQRIG